MNNYRFYSSEPTTAAGNEYETKALLHLLCFSEDSGDIDLFAVDCFNDVTGMNSSCITLHDVQSKSGKAITPSELGKDLVTLLENRMSSFSPYFATYTLFVGGVSPKSLQDKTLEEFEFHHLTPKAQESIRKHLKEEYGRRLDHRKKRYSSDDFSDSELGEDVLDEFLSQVRFVVGKKDTADYIRPLIRTATKLLPNVNELRHIFTQIRDMQSKLKNRSPIVGDSIQHPRDVMSFNRILYRRKIELLVIERLLDRDFLGHDTPKSFEPYLNGFAPDEDLDELVEDCRNAISLFFFDKNGRDTFWKLFDEIVYALDNNPEADITAISRAIDEEVISNCPKYLDGRSLLYFIAIMKDGIKS